MKVLLASGSPRRIELLKTMGFSVRVCPSGADENFDFAASPEEISSSLALRKALAVAPFALDGEYVVAADTSVYSDGVLLGKPKTEDEAYGMLASLSGKIHFVYTGIAVIHGEKTYCGYEKTAVEFKELTKEHIKNYLATGESMDKAGAYGIQGYGSSLVKAISGDYFNVVGLPVAKLCEVLKKEFGVEELSWLDTAKTEK